MSCPKKCAVCGAGSCGTKLVVVDGKYYCTKDIPKPSTPKP